MQHVETRALPTRLPPVKGQGDIRSLLEKDCEMEMMRFLRKIGIFEEI